MRRIGAVPYLNADPLVEPLRDRRRFPDVQLRAMVPSLLLEALLRGEVEAALVSAAGVLPEPRLRILPTGCVAARGAVRSIQLYGRRPLAEVRSVALDASSRSAAALTRLVFRARFGRDPEYVTLPPDLEAMLERADAALLIGNPCLAANERLDTGAWTGPPVARTDLGAEWFRLTGLPFVYAVWAVPETVEEPQSLARLLEEALASGLEQREALARAGARQIGIPEPEARRYLLETIRYRLGPEERAGLERFCALGRELGVLSPGAGVRYALMDVPEPPGYSPGPGAPSPPDPAGFRP